MKIKLTITVADNGNPQTHIQMLIRRMRGRKTVVAPQALDEDVPGAQEPAQSAVLQVPARAFSWADILEKTAGQPFFTADAGDFEKNVRLRHRTMT